MVSRFWDRLQLLCQVKGTNPTAVARNVGLSNSIAVRWKRGSIPNKAALQKLADYFSVTPDYLLGYGDADELPAPSLLPEPEGDAPVTVYRKDFTAEEWELLQKIESLDGEDAIALRNFLQYLLDRKEKQNSDAGGS